MTAALIEFDFTRGREVVRFHPERKASAMDRALDDISRAMQRHRKITREAVAAVAEALT
jgi:hypothetical protein